MLGVEGKSVYLLDIRVGRFVARGFAKENLDGKVVLLSNERRFAYAQWNKGMFCQCLESGRSVWSNEEAKRVSKVRVSADGRFIVAARNDPPTTLLLSAESGKTIHRIDQCVDAFVGTENDTVLALGLDLCFKTIEGDEKAQWSSFAVFEAVFGNNAFVASGPSGIVTSYSLPQLSIIAEATDILGCERVGPMFYDVDRSVVRAVVVRPDNRPVLALCEFGADLNSPRLIADLGIEHGVTFCDGGHKLCSTSGKVFDASNGTVLMQLNWPRLFKDL